MIKYCVRSKKFLILEVWNSALFSKIIYCFIFSFFFPFASISKTFYRISTSVQAQTCHFRREKNNHIFSTDGVWECCRVTNLCCLVARKILSQHHSQDIECKIKLDKYKVVHMPFAKSNMDSFFLCHNLTFNSNDIYCQPSLMYQ